MKYNRGCHLKYDSLFYHTAICFRTKANSAQKWRISVKQIELLAPAGDFECFKAAINAGADAIYLAGNKFGARAYANNFTEEEIIMALKQAHILKRKIYLTVNTLVKESEIDELVPYIKPLYEAGLDGVIVQDIGALEIIRENFPQVELHASTQMTITGIYGAQLLKKLGVCRVVPARELSLEEISDIKKATGLEIESFIHGAMCYAYSGQCLFSSILGGRSGNRGRCAGPCRLPYKDKKGQTIYPLSLKDMYTLPIIPKLIQAGVDSFKIEGRMKSPEYVAGVTAMYRKYIDMYLANPQMPFKISKKDEDFLRNLYIRSDICHGYYEQHNGKNMITIKEPGYSGGNATVLAEIKERYLSKQCTLPIKGEVSVCAGQPARLILRYNKITVLEEGETVSVAMNRPLTENDIRNRIGKLGDTHFNFAELIIETDEQSFLPVKALNELRRSACKKMEEAILRSVTDARSNDAILNTTNDIYINPFKTTEKDKNTQMLVATVTTKEQLEEVLLSEVIDYIYVSADLIVGARAEIIELLKKYAQEKRYFLSMPHILRKRSYAYLPEYQKILQSEDVKFEGVLIRNHETLQWLTDIKYQGMYIADSMLYAWNRKTAYIYNFLVNRTTVPIELNKREILHLGEETNKEIVIYGHLPLMYSANCIQKTLESCVNDKNNVMHKYSLTDRYKNQFSIIQNCKHCYNILYNTVPMSLHGQLKSIMAEKFGAYRLEFSIEDREVTKQIVQYYSNLWKQKDIVLSGEFPVKDFTNGHYKRGVE